jgi:hypothetical protein
MLATLAFLIPGLTVYGVVLALPALRGVVFAGLVATDLSLSVYGAMPALALNIAQIPAVALPIGLIGAFAYANSRLVEAQGEGLRVKRLSRGIVLGAGATWTSALAI